MRGRWPNSIVAATRTTVIALRIGLGSFEAGRRTSEPTQRALVRCLPVAAWQGQLVLTVHTQRAVLHD